MDDNLKPTITARPRAAQAAPMPGGELDSFIGHELCGYTIQRKLAEGGMGVVYEGVHGKIGRRGAIKVLKLELCRSDEVVERFHQEARAVNAIRHDNIVDIYDFGRDRAGRVFFVMEYLEGEPLSGRLRRGAMGWSEAMPVLDQTLRALKAAHDKGFVHRDLKPDNIWLRDAGGAISVKLLDFGIAKLVGSDSPREKLTRTGSIIGTPHYMSPEQINGAKDVDQRTDLYALGVIIYEMFAGVTPFVGDTLQAIMTGHLFTEPPRLAGLPGDLRVPATIAEIVDRMLVKDPAGRYASASDVLDDLRDVHRNRPPANAMTLSRTWPARTRIPEPALAPVPADESRRRRRAARWAIGGAAIAAAAFAGVAVTRSPEPTIVRTPDPTPAPVPAPRPPEPTKPEPPLPIDSTLRDQAVATMQAQFANPIPAVRTYVADAAAVTRDRHLIEKLTELTQSDPDDEVRARAGAALAALGASSAAPLLAKQEASAPPALKALYSAALARLGDPRALVRLLGHARSKDLDVALPACLELAGLVRSGDPRAIEALKRIVRRADELDQRAGDRAKLDRIPSRKAELGHREAYPTVAVLATAAALRDKNARNGLYAMLDDTDDGTRYAAAVALASLGDDAGREVLRATFATADSPDQLDAAVALVALGEYGGLELMIAKLDDRDPAVRRIAAHGLADLGERAGLRRLVAAETDGDGAVQASAASAILVIVGLDPQVLAQASLAWTEDAFDSPDPTKRSSAARVFADLPVNDAVPLYARAFADPSRDVRLIASQTAARSKSREVAQQMTTVVEAEPDPQVKEQQVLALGQIGDPVAHDVLERISVAPGRIGVLASGALIAVGDVAGLTRLEVAIAARKPELRLAAVEAASAANNPIVVPTLKLGLLDTVLHIQFIAAEGLAGYGAEQLTAVRVLEAALTDKDASLVGRALAALARFGAQLSGLALRPIDLINAPDPRRRLAALPAVRALAIAQRLPLLRRLAADPDLEVRRAVVDAFEDVAIKDKEPDQAARLCRPLVNDPDPVVRAKASGQLSRLRPPAPPPGTKLAVRPAPDPAADAKLEQAVAAKLAEASAAAAAASAASDAVDQLATEIETAIGATSDAAAVRTVKDLQVRLKDETTKLDASAAKVAAATTAAGDAAGAAPPTAVAKRLAGGRSVASETRARRGAAASKATALQAQIDDFGTPGVQILLDSAKLSVDLADFRVARTKLDEAARLVRRAGATNTRLDDLYAELYLGMARNADNPADKRKHLQSAEAVYRRIQSSAIGVRAQDADDHLKAIAEELQ